MSARLKVRFRDSTLSVKRITTSRDKILCEGANKLYEESLVGALVMYIIIIIYVK